MSHQCPNCVVHSKRIAELEAELKRCERAFDALEKVGWTYDPEIIPEDETGVDRDLISHYRQQASELLGRQKVTVIDLHTQPKDAP